MLSSQAGRNKALNPVVQTQPENHSQNRTKVRFSRHSNHINHPFVSRGPRLRLPEACASRNHCILPEDEETEKRNGSAVDKEMVGEKEMDGDTNEVKRRDNKR